MDLRQFEVLQAIAETGSFRAAARRLHVTQPAISHRLKSLEAELDETLVARDVAPATLTPAGLGVLAVANRVLGEVAELRRRFRPDDDAEIHGVLRVTASTLGLVYLYGDLLERFIAEHPRIELVLTATETPLDGARQVASLLADVALTPFPVDSDRLATLELQRTRHVVIAAPGHPLAGRKRLTVRELRRHPFVRYQTGAGSRLVSDALFQEHGGYPPIFLESNDTEFVKRIVGLGLAVALVPGFTVAGESAAGRLKALRLAGHDLDQAFGLAYRDDVRIATLRAFRDFCASHRELVPH